MPSFSTQQGGKDHLPLFSKQNSGEITKCHPNLGCLEVNLPSDLILSKFTKILHNLANLKKSYEK